MTSEEDYLVGYVTPCDDEQTASCTLMSSQEVDSYNVLVAHWTFEASTAITRLHPSVRTSDWTAYLSVARTELAVRQRIIMSQTSVSFSEIYQSATLTRVHVLAVAILALTFSLAGRANAQLTVINIFDNEDSCDGVPFQPASPVYSGILAQARDGNIYGTTSLGGACGYNAGTIYQMTTSGNLTVVYSFGTSSPEGVAANGGLTLAPDGNLYGTTKAGGANKYGTIFMFSISDGTVTYLHNFNVTDGAYPTAPPIRGTDGYFYGTTWQGGSGIGTVYRMAPKSPWTLTSYSLPGDAFPTAPLMQATDGNFYGTTFKGGTHDWGTVFQMTPKGKLKTIYSFDGAHGSFPNAPVIQGSDGNFYGTTSAGGNLSACSGNGCGVVFQLTPKGKIAVLYSFNDTSDGSDPLGGLLEATDGSFYGVTSVGGTADGTLYQLTPQGKNNFIFTVPFQFSFLTSGRHPQLTLLQHTSGLVYGDTLEGGTITEEGGGTGTGTGTFYSFFEQGMTPFAGLVTTSGKVGDPVDILGQGFTGATSVSFGGTSAAFTVVSDTYVSAVVPAGTSGLVSVMSPGGTLQSNKIYRVTPVLKSFTPSSGPVGTSVTIKGAGLINATKITFGGVAASTFSVTSDTQVNATVPSGAKSGKIGVTTPGGMALTPGTFTVTP